MATSTDTAPDARVREFLAAGDTRRALHRARDLVERQLAALRVSDPPRAALLDAALAGSLTAMAEGLPSWQPRKPPGYDAGPPAAEHLIAAYETARTDGTRRRR